MRTIFILSGLPASDNHRRLARIFLSVTLCCATSLSHAAQSPTLDFDKTFNASGESRQMHYRASYLLDGKSHQLELWRDRNVRLKRRTDDSIETRLFKSAGQTEWQMVVLDLKRRIRTDIDRTNLARIGHFTDWFGQSHGLAHPVGPYQLHKLSARERPTVAPHPAMACQWYALNQNNSNSAICWSAALHLPITITDAHGEVQWHITAADSLPLNQKEFLIDDQDFAKNDANDDIRAD